MAGDFLTFLVLSEPTDSQTQLDRYLYNCIYILLHFVLDSLCYFYMNCLFYLSTQ